MSKKRLIITSVISIVLVAVLMLGSTYSIFTTSEVDENANVYKTGNLDVTYTLSSDNVQITDSSPMSIEEADAVFPYRITVTNNGNVPYMFDVVLTDTTASNAIDSKYIMTKVGYLEPKKLSSCTNNVIKEDVILPAGESVDIDVRVWLGANLSNSEIGKSFYAKLSIDGLAVYDNSTDIDNSILSLNYMKKLFSSNGDYYRADTYREKIKTAAFVDYIDTTNAVDGAVWDVTEIKEGSATKPNTVVIWLENSSESGYYDLYFGSNNQIYCNDLSGLFLDVFKVTSINFDNLNTGLTTNMFAMVTSSKTNGEEINHVYMEIQSLDLSTFNTSNVENMSQMFRGCANLTSLDLSGFDSENVTTMQSMFYLCHQLQSIDLSNFNTSNVTDMSYMFNFCKSLTNLDLNKFNTSNVTNMQSMFQGCHGLISLDLSSFDTSNVNNMRHMFVQCYLLEELDVSNFDTSSVIDMAYMFSSCNVLTSLDVSNFDTSNVTNMESMFQLCSSLTSLDLSNFNTSNVTNMSNMFSAAYKVSVTITITSNSNIVNSVTYNDMFHSAASQGGTITVNYTSATSTIVDNMLTTKSNNSNVVKGSLVS